MNSVLVRPAPGAVVRAAGGALEITVVSSAAHWLAGGMLPSAGWILASAMPLFGIGVLLQRGRLALPAALAAAGAGQLFLHVMLVQEASSGHMHAAGPTWPMVVAHAVGALATVLVWSLRRHAWDVLVRVGRVRIAAVHRTALAWDARVDGVDAWLLWMGARRRGPPVWVLR